MNKYLGRFVAPVLALMMVACSTDVSYDAHIERARGFMEQGEINSATIELKSALQINAGSGVARALLGSIEFESGNYLEAEKELSKALVSGADDDAVIPLLAQVLLLLGKTDDLLALSSEGLLPDGQAILLAAQGRARLASGQSYAAGRIIDKALTASPQSPYALLAETILKQARGESSDIVRAGLQNVVSIDPEFSEAWAMLGDLEKRQGDPELALEHYTRALETGGLNVAVLLKRAVINIEAGRLDEAQQDLTTLKQVNVNNLSADYLQGIVYSQKQEHQRAISAFEAPLGNERVFPQAILYVASSHFVLGNYEQATRYANRFAALEPGNRQGNILLARVQLVNQNYEGAEVGLRELLSTDQEDPVLRGLLASALLRQGKIDEGIALLHQLAEGESNSAEVQFQLGVAYTGLNERDTALVHFGNAITLSPGNHQAYAAMVLMHLQLEQFDQAESVALDYIQQKPGTAAPYTLLGRVQMARGRLDDATQSFHRSLEFEPGDPFASGFLMDLALGDGNPGEARKLGEQVLEAHPNHLNTLLKLAKIDLKENNKSLMVERLEQAILAHPEEVSPRIMLARYYLAVNDSDKVAVALGPFFRKPGNNPAVLEAIGMSQLIGRDYLAASQTLEKLATLRPTDITTHFMLSQAYGGLGEAVQMERELNSTVTLSPGHFKANLALAKLYLSRGQGEEVADKLVILKDINPEHADVLLVEGALEKANGNHDSAMALYKSALEVAPSTGNMLAVSRYQSELGNGEEAFATMNSWVKARPGDVVARHALAGAYAATGQINEANDQYRKIIQLDDNNPAALNNLAWNLRKSDPKEALQLAERASKIGSPSPAILDTYALVLLSNGKTEDAYRAMQRALEQQPNRPDFLYHQAMILRQMGKLAAAEESLAQALATESTFDKRDEAAALLDSIRREQ